MEPQQLEFIEYTLRHMNQVAAGRQQASLLLTGEPGVGKTTSIGLLSRLLGISKIVIEVPHISEEHLINIPFIVFNDMTGTKKSLTAQMDNTSMVLAKSNLFSQIQTLQKIPDNVYLKHIQSSPKQIKKLYAALGGTETTIPEEIQRARSQFKVIVFLDEYYRTTTVRIRNILRDMLNGKIGMHDIPKNAYLVYASNMQDAGIDDIPNNNEFIKVEHKTPTAASWFEYLEDKFEEDNRVKLHPTIMKAFKKILTDEDMSHLDIATNVRTSPRRWEQLLLMVNSSLPAKDEDSAKALLTNVKNNFIHYIDKTHGNLSDKVVDAVTKLIKETSNIDIGSTDILHDDKWRSSLLHMVQQQMKLGDHMKHIPVVSGPPGVGKTTNALAVANELNLRLVHISVDKLAAEDLVGIPLPGHRTNDEISVKFAVPMLFHMIDSQIKKEDAEYKAQLTEKYKGKAKEMFAEYEKQEWKYLIFFDEITRTTAPVFNALRRILLEKNFGPKGDESGEVLEMPKHSLVIAAMNPTGVGTSELTSHFRDVINVIPVAANWTETKKHLMSLEVPDATDNDKQATITIIDTFAQRFSDPNAGVGKNQAAFHLNVGFDFIVSAREYTSMFSDMTTELHAVVKKLMKTQNISEQQFREKIDTNIFESFKRGLGFVLDKHAQEGHEFLATLSEWVKTLDDSIFGGLLTQKADVKKHLLSDTLTGYLQGKKLELMPEDEHIINSNDAIDNSDFIHEIQQAITNVITNKKSIEKFIIQTETPMVELKKRTIIAGKGEKVSLLTNFVLSLLYTLHIHEYQNDRLVAVGKGVSTTTTELLKKLFTNSDSDKDEKEKAAKILSHLRAAIFDAIDNLGD